LNGRFWDAVPLTWATETGRTADTHCRRSADVAEQRCLVFEKVPQPLYAFLPYSTPDSPALRVHLLTSLPSNAEAERGEAFGMQPVPDRIEAAIGRVRAGKSKSSKA
jgi:hypothetical protein